MTTGAFEAGRVETGEVRAACWSCGSPVSDKEHFCAQCGKVQPTLAGDYFSFFGLRRLLEIDLAELKREFYRLSRKLHPDMYARATSREKEWSLEKSSLLNDAYRTLKNPIARTEYLLELEGVKLEEQSKAATDLARQTGKEKQQVVPADLLEEAFALNMQLEEMRMARKMGEFDPNLERDLQAARAQFESKLKASEQELRDLWKQWDKTFNNAGSHDTSANDAGGIEERAKAERNQVRDKMVAVLNRRSYIRNLVRDVNEALGN